MRVVVVNAGLGGVVVGAHRAGAQVAAALEADATLVAGLRANLEGHDLPCEDVAILELRDDATAARRLAAALEAHPPADDLHVHVSVPPDKAAVEAARVREALACLGARGDASWSIVAKVSPETRRVLVDASAREPARVAFDLLDSAALGAPQARQRLVAGPPELLHAMHVRRAATTRRGSVREALEASGLTLPSEHLKNQTRSTNTAAPCTRSVDAAAYTLCGSHALTWCDAKGKTVRLMSPREGAVLMGLPGDWALPEGRREAQRAVGGATCALLGEVLTRAAQDARRAASGGGGGGGGVGSGVGSDALLAVLGGSPEPPFAMNKKQYRTLKRRLSALELALETIANAKR
jgi:site-specific DNA-cytosine methylase